MRGLIILLLALMVAAEIRITHEAGGLEGVKMIASAAMNNQDKIQEAAKDGPGGLAKAGVEAGVGLAVEKGMTLVAAKYPAAKLLTPLVKKGAQSIVSAGYKQFSKKDVTTRAPELVENPAEKAAEVDDDDPDDTSEVYGGMKELVEEKADEGEKAEEKKPEEKKGFFEKAKDLIKGDDETTSAPTEVATTGRPQEGGPLRGGERRHHAKSEPDDEYDEEEEEEEEEKPRKKKKKPKKKRAVKEEEEDDDDGDDDDDEVEKVSLDNQKPKNLLTRSRKPKRSAKSKDIDVEIQVEDGEDSSEGDFLIVEDPSDEEAKRPKAKFIRITKGAKMPKGAYCACIWP